MDKQNPFKDIEQSDLEVPKDLKDRVMQNVIAAKSLMEIELGFVKNLKATMSSLFKLVMYDK